ncbi:metallopeptidase family protein [Candidatus Omnitrophota bacterium]
MNRKEFEELAIKAIEELPEGFKNKLENVDIVIEDEPNMDQVKTMKLGSKGRLLGLYEGVPLRARTHYYGMVLPDKITLFKSNIERVCNVTGTDPYYEIRHVLQHEIAHHFGISDQRLRDLGTY